MEIFLGFDKLMLLQEMTQELSLSQEKNKIGVTELAKKEEQLVVLQVFAVLTHIIVCKQRRVSCLTVC